MGVPEYEAKRYEGKVKEGGILISVHTEDADEAELVQTIFQDEDAEDIATASESSTHEKAAR